MAFCAIARHGSVDLAYTQQNSANIVPQYSSRFEFGMKRRQYHPFTQDKLLKLQEGPHVSDVSPVSKRPRTCSGHASKLKERETALEDEDAIEDLKAKLASSEIEAAELESELQTSTAMGDVAIPIRLRAMKDYLLSCLGEKEGTVGNSPKLSPNARAFWSSQWQTQPGIMTKGFSRPQNQGKGTVRNSGDKSAHSAVVEEDSQVVCGMEGDAYDSANECFKILYRKDPRFYLDSPGYQRLGNIHCVAKYRLNTKVKSDKTSFPVLASHCLQQMEKMLDEPSPPPEATVYDLEVNVTAVIF
ncbi:hypothetical protein TWF481_010218 [Arthrobotrys musiformis]|uniref:Uncharacterized protein n=1 Tax=Arthrobotrys musiformis TaxID=47236 RepID=A0AAV9W202_9PEZI